MRWVLRALAAFCVLAAGMGNAQQAPKRIALVIGNGGYQLDAWKLANPPRDAALMAQRLRALGFEVDAVNDATRAAMEAAFDRFGTKLKASGPEAVSFFYYAGHGAQVDGVNYLIPTDANAPTMMRLRYQATPMQLLLDDMIDAGNAVNVIVLDACRNLPLPEGPRTLAGGGLADLGKPQNFFIAYATAPGSTAADGAGANSPFTTALAAALERQAADPIELLFSDVNSRVYRATEGGQSPEYRNGLVRAPRWSLASARQAPPAPTTPGTVFRDYPECPEMVVVPAGSFVMGAPELEAGRSSREGPQHEVKIENPFAVGRYELTFAQWDSCAAAGGCAPPDEPPYDPDDFLWGRQNRPVVMVSWQDAKRYVRWLNGRVGGNAYRLLTEAEWEYAARAGTTTPFSFGSTISTAQANYSPLYGESIHGENRHRTMPVGSFPANAFGLYDMHGNVAELVEDCRAETYDYVVETDGAANTSQGCNTRVVRGGWWGGNQRSLRSASRSGQAPSERSIDAGFRIARTLSTP